jgi:hypothetical protein
MPADAARSTPTGAANSSAQRSLRPIQLFRNRKGLA